MNGLGGKTQIVKLAKAAIGTPKADGSFSDDLAAALNELQAGDGTTDVATYVIAGMEIATAEVFVAVQGTGTIPASTADYGASGVTLTLEVTFEDA